MKAPLPAPSPGRWTLLTSEPHRFMFFLGALQAIAAMAWWLPDVAARYLGVHAAHPWSVPALWAHGWLLLYGLFPFFMFGFLMTAGPNWLGAGKMPRAAFVPAGLGMAAGLVLVYAGLFASRVLVGIGALLHLAGWAWGTAALVRVALRHWNPNARYVLVIFTFLTVGLIGDAVFALSVLSESYAIVAPALHGAVWFFLLPIYIAVSTRMVPFFSGRILGSAVEYRPWWARPALIGGTLAHGLLALAGAQHWLWLVDLPLAFAVLRLARKWGLGRSGGVRLLAMLHLALAMLAFALAASGLASLAAAAGWIAHVGYGPLHLIVIGYFAAMVVAMVSRVSLGHSGRPLEADTLTWHCFLGVIGAALLRAAAEIAPQPAAGMLIVGAAALWLVAFGAWTWRYLPIYWSPRADER
jgi:uncharacterized protein involved in response to NO